MLQSLQLAPNSPPNRDLAILDWGWSTHLFDERMLSDAARWAQFCATWLRKQASAQAEAGQKSLESASAAVRFGRMPAGLVKVRACGWKCVGRSAQRIALPTAHAGKPTSRRHILPLLHPSPIDYVRRVVHDCHSNTARRVPQRTSGGRRGPLLLRVYAALRSDLGEP